MKGNIHGRKTSKSHNKILLLLSVSAIILIRNCRISVPNEWNTSIKDLFEVGPHCKLPNRHNKVLKVSVK